MIFGTNPQQKAYRKMGFFSDSDGIIQRYAREKDNWNQHLENTKQAIEQFCQKIGGNHIVVLGSGWLLDVPIEFLYQNFSQITLVDIKHPNAILYKYSNQPKINFVTQDITQLAYVFFEQIRKKNATFQSLFELTQRPITLQKIGVENADVVISLNILNQLDIIILDYLKKHVSLSSQQELALRQAIQKQHIKMLPTNKTCLITDYNERNYDKKHQQPTQNKTVFTDLKKHAQWEWAFDMQGRYKPGLVTYFDVMVSYV